MTDYELQLYNDTLDGFLGASYCLSAGYELLSMVGMIGVYWYIAGTERQYGPLGERWEQERGEQDKEKQDKGEQERRQNREGKENGMQEKGEQKRIVQSDMIKREGSNGLVASILISS